MRYRAGSYKYPTNSLDGIIGIVAVEDDTSISIFNASRTLVDTRVTIDQGQVLKSRQGEDMTGWSIVADKPVAAFSGNVCTSMGDGFAGSTIVSGGISRFLVCRLPHTHSAVWL
jgi:hypothetical protein